MGLSRGPPSLLPRPLRRFPRGQSGSVVPRLRSPGPSAVERKQRKEAAKEKKIAASKAGQQRWQLNYSFSPSQTRRLPVQRVTRRTDHLRGFAVQRSGYTLSSLSPALLSLTLKHTHTLLLSTYYMLGIKLKLCEHHSIFCTGLCGRLSIPTVQIRKASVTSPMSAGHKMQR